MHNPSKLRKIISAAVHMVRYWISIFLLVVFDKLELKFFGRVFLILPLSSCRVAGKSAVRHPQQILPERNFHLPPIMQFGRVSKKGDFANWSHTATFPAVSLFEFHNAKIIGGSEMLISEQNELLYDELALGDPARYGCKAKNIIPSQWRGKQLPACRKAHVAITIPNSNVKKIERGIHLMKDHSSNYYHWLFECLPRAMVALKDRQYADYPILLDMGLPSQYLESLQKISGKRPVIQVPRGEMCEVGELIFPSVMSYMHDNYSNDVSATDILIAPEAVQMLREEFVPTKNHATPKKKLYVARDGARYRRLRNEQDVIRMVKECGFEVVYPENLSFNEQVALFSDASVVVGPTGAGMSNMVFAPKGCKVIVFAGATTGANCYIFGQLGHWLGHNLVYMLGYALHPNKFHSDYEVDLVQCKSLLQD